MFFIPTPDAQCMEYLPAFGLNLGQMQVNIPYIEHLGTKCASDFPVPFVKVSHVETRQTRNSTTCPVTSLRESKLGGEWMTAKMCTVTYTWSNYRDLTRPHPKWWFSKGNPLILGKSRLVKCYNLTRFTWYPKQAV